MKFVKIEDLREGMRLARPIYSKKGILLFERDSKLNSKGIESIRNFGLIGLFVLEPAEPAPPLTLEDIEFERFQTVQAFAIMDELNLILQTGRTSKLHSIVAVIAKNYGNLDKKINFMQGLRTKEDYLFKHALNVAMLCALIGHKYNMRIDDLNETITSAILHDIGKMSLPEELLNIDERTANDEIALEKYQQAGFEIIDHLFQSQPNVRRIASQSLVLLQAFRNNTGKGNMKIVEGAKVMVVAEYFDRMTAIRFGEQPDTAFAVIRKMRQHPEIFDERVVKALVNSINILTKGVSVVLNTGDTALIISENPRNILRPTVFSFRDSNIMNLDDTYTYGDIEIVDVMRTMDKRYVFDKEKLKKQGVSETEAELITSDSEQHPEDR